jgi:hypothetical protein
MLIFGPFFAKLCGNLKVAEGTRWSLPVFGWGFRSFWFARVILITPSRESLTGLPINHLSRVNLQGAFKERKCLFSSLVSTN